MSFHYGRIPQIRRLISFCCVRTTPFCVSNPSINRIQARDLHLPCLGPRRQPVYPRQYIHSVLQHLPFNRTMSSEVDKALGTGPEDHKGETIFGKIIDKKLSVDIIYEDDLCIAFHDIAPQAPIHFLVIPKKRISMLEKVTPDDKEILGYLLIKAKEVAETLDLKRGYRVVINNGKQGCQSVYHLHLHVLGGKQLGWPPG